jgi:tRNA(Arg) A34 adenosine deaminase TadA
MTPHGRCECGCVSRHASRRAFIAAFACAAVLPLAAPPFAAIAAAQTPADDERFMRIALEEARAADFPFGAVIVRDGAVLARGRNLGRTLSDPTAHGEMVAIRRVVAAYGGAALRGATLYSTGEPCPMCMGAILWSHMARLVFAASMQQLASTINQPRLTSRDIAAATPFAPIAITGGVLADEAMALFAK